jgi:ribonuclease BN (tRNA processing enzyme)
MNIIILGAGTAIPMADYSSPSLAMLIEGKAFLFDIGPDALHQIARTEIDFNKIENIFITHFHPDHTSGLIHLLFATRNPDMIKTRKPFTITGPKGIKTLVLKLEEAYHDWLSLPPGLLKIDELDIGKSEKRIFSEFTITSKRVRHSEHSIAYRIEDRSGKSFVYSGDTEYCDGIIELAYNCDLLVLECSFPEGKYIEGHLTPSQAGKIADQARAKRLVLVHFYPEVLKTDIESECRKSYKGEISLGRDLMSFII